jgi:hypothetical protein
MLASGTPRSTTLLTHKAVISVPLSCVRLQISKTLYRFDLRCPFDLGNNAALRLGLPHVSFRIPPTFQAGEEPAVYSIQWINSVSAESSIRFALSLWSWQQSLQPSQNCHSERSDAAVIFSFAPANEPRHAVEESLFDVSVVESRVRASNPICRARLILPTITPIATKLSFRAERRGLFPLVRSCERATSRSRGIPLRCVRRRIPSLRFQSDLQFPSDLGTNATLRLGLPHVSFRIPPPFHAGEESAVHSIQAMATVAPIAIRLSFRPERADAFSSASLLRSCRLAKWRNLSSMCPTSNTAPSLPSGFLPQTAQSLAKHR